MKVWVGFQHNHSLVAKAIQWFTRSKWNHCFMVYQYGTEAIVVEANAGGVQKSLLCTKDPKSYTLIPIPLNDADDVIFDVMNVYIGKPYGYLQLFGLAIPSLLERIGLHIKNICGFGIICSELCYLILKRLLDKKSVYYTRLQKLDRNNCAPDDIYDVVR
jgi:hypothetical protein